MTADGDFSVHTAKCRHAVASSCQQLFTSDVSSVHNCCLPLFRIGVAVMMLLTRSLILFGIDSVS